MGFYRNWQPSKTEKRKFAAKMQEIETFLSDHPDISASRSSDSYYFTIQGVDYRISNHSPESSPYHDGREAGTRYIHAGKTRIIEIYSAIAAGKKVDGRGNIVDQ